MESTTNASGRASLGRWIARLLAILAVAGAALALYLVIAASNDSPDEREGKRANREAPKEQPEKPEKPPETYVVQPGDTLAGIAASVGMQVERIEELNPEIDPQALPSGATLQLR